MKRALLLSAILLVSSFCFAQQVEVNRNNKTIAVNAQASESADPDLAIVIFSYQNYGTSTDDAYKKNVATAAAIVKAMLDAGVPKEVIVTGQIQLSPVSDRDEKWTPEERKLRQVSAQQSWTVRLPVADAQRLVDLVMKAGANKIDSVSWDLIDRASLQAKASGTALAKARAVADQMAKGLSAKLGELVYASNFAPEERERYVEQFWSRRSSSSNMSWLPESSAPSLVLFPQKVKETAQVHAVFAIE